MTGQIRVTVQREDRLRAITALANAIEQVAKALNTAPHVVITGNYMRTEGTAISVDVADEVTETQIVECDGVQP